MSDYSQTPDAVREALERRKAVNAILAPLLAPLVPDVAERIRIGNEACTAILAALDSRAGDAGEGQDRKFAFRNGQFVNRVSGEPIPHDEPIIIFRARDHHAIPVLREYLTMATDEHHRQAIRDRLTEFAAYRDAHPDRMKEPGITHHIELNVATPVPAPNSAGDAGEGDDPDHQYAVVSANYARPFLAGAYPTLDAALLAQDGKPERWHIYRRISATPSPAVDVKEVS